MHFFLSLFLFLIRIFSSQEQFSFNSFNSFTYFFLNERDKDVSFFFRFVSGFRKKVEGVSIETYWLFSFSAEKEKLIFWDLSEFLFYIIWFVLSKYN